MSRSYRHYRLEFEICSLHHSESTQAFPLQKYYRIRNSKCTIKIAMAIKSYCKQINYTCSYSSATVRKANCNHLRNLAKWNVNHHGGHSLIVLATIWNFFTKRLIIERLYYACMFYLWSNFDFCLLKHGNGSTEHWPFIYIDLHNRKCSFTCSLIEHIFIVCSKRLKNSTSAICRLSLCKGRR